MRPETPKMRSEISMAVDDRGVTSPHVRRGSERRHPHKSDRQGAAREIRAALAAEGY